jgi:TonB-linked SusC/RagA family outer membrane protein
MKTKLNGILTLLLALVVQVAFAQQTVTGKVTGPDGDEVIGAVVSVKGTSTFASTDFDGNYTIQASPESVLVFSYTGYTSQEITVGNQTTINVSMASDALDTVVVVGYRTLSKPRSNVAVSTITSETIENRPNASFVQTLSGQVAGLNIATGSGQPGANSTVQLRGVNSINGNTEPLFIIDGAPVDEDNFRSLNPQEIESVSVLKDAGATAIYGNRGANGVIIVTTRRGKFEQPLKVTATSILSFSTIQDNDYNLMNAQQELRLERDFGNGDGVGLTDAEIDARESTNWVDEFFRTGVTKNNTVNLSSGGKNTSQFTSLGYFEQDGILVQSNLKRFNLRNNITGKSENGKFKYNTSVSLNYSVNDEPNAIGGTGVNRNYILGAYQGLPYLNPSDYTPGEGGSIPGQLRFAPLLLLDRLATYTRTEEEVKVLGTLDFSYEINDNFTISSTTGMDYQNAILLRSEGPDAFNSVFFAGAGEDLPGTQDQQTNRTFSINSVTSLRYNKSWDKHTVDAAVYTEYFKAHLRNFGFRQQGLDPRTFFPGDGAGFVDFNADLGFYDDIANATIRNAGLFSYFASADYDFDSKYGASATIRRDASYRFAETNRWGTFYSVSGRWNISQEDFMADSVFDSLKLRASYGTTGNQRIVDGGYFTAPDLYRDLYTTTTAYGGVNSSTLFNANGLLGGIGNPDLRWETVSQFNVGVDYELFESRLRGSVDVYAKKTEDLFQSSLVSGTNGIYSINANTGDLKNTGVDLDIKYDILRNPNGFNLTAGLNANYNKQELQNLPNADGEIPGVGRNGGKLFEYYLVRYAGVNPANGELLFLTADGDVTENPDVDTDRVWTGKNVFPDVQGAFTLNADYKGFYASAQMNFTIGRDRVDNDYAGFLDSDDIGSFRHSTDILRAWTPDNRITDIPSNTASNRNLGSNDRFIRDADFLRMRFATLGYNFQRNTLEKFGLTKLNIFVNAENLFTLTKWKGYDVEPQSNTSLLYPAPRIISVGLEIGI